MANDALIRSAPHDAFFRVTFERPEHAEGLLRTLLPAELVARADFATLELMPGSFIDTELRELETDLLFRFKLGGRETLMFALVEHQSRVDATMPLRLLRYMVRVWERWQREQPEPRPLPAILPVVVAHAERPWAAPTSLVEMMDLGASASVLHPHVVNFRFILDDLSSGTAETLLQRREMSAMGRLVLLHLRYARDVQTLLSLLPSWRLLVREVAEGPRGADDLVTILVYTRVVTGKQPEELGDLFSDELGSGRGEVMGAVERLAKELAPIWRSEGRDEGRVEGRMEGRAELLLRQLGKRFGPVAPDAEARLRAASIDELDRIADRVLEARTLEEALDSNK